MMERRHFHLSWPTDKESREMNDFPSPLYEHIVKGERREVLYHYTSVESLLKIIDLAEIKFSRIDRVNDPLEKLSLAYDELYKAAYLACFNYDQDESIPLWKMYTSKGLGVRIGFFFKGHNIHKNLVDSNRKIVDKNRETVDWINVVDEKEKCTARLMIKDVQYSEKYFSIAMAFEGEMVDIMPDEVGAYKTTIWDYEKETRMVLYLMDEDKARALDSDYLLVPLNTDYIDRIEVRFDPWMSKEMKRCVELGVDEYSKRWKVNVTFADSALRNRIT